MVLFFCEDFMIESVISFFTAAPLWELALIFFTKIIEVSMGTLRSILVNRGYRKQGSVLAFFEVILWVFVASQVINGIAAAPLKGIIYSLGFAVGVSLGSIIENRLAFGKILIQTIVSEKKGQEVADTVRQRGFGVTTIPAEGKDSSKTVLMIFAKRKSKDDIIGYIRSADPDAMIIANDAAHLSGGHINAGLISLVRK